MGALLLALAKSTCIYSIVSGWYLYWTVIDFLWSFGCDQDQNLKNESVNMVMQIKQPFIMLTDG